MSALCCSVDSLDGLDYKKLKDEDDDKYRIRYADFISLNQNSFEIYMK